MSQGLRLRYGRTPGESRGCWVIPEQGVVVDKQHGDKWGLRAESVRIHAPQVHAWLVTNSLYGVRFESRRDALAALSTALAVDPPPWPPGEHPIGPSSWREND